MMRFRSGLAVASLALTTFSVSAHAATLQEECRASKNAAGGKYYACLQGAVRKLATTGDAAKYDAAVTKCSQQFSTAWQKAEDRAAAIGGTCEPTGDGAVVQLGIAAQSACTADALEGNAACLTCGNGTIDAGEDCDLGALGGATCDSATAGALPGGTLNCSAACSFDTSACNACEAMVDGACWFLGLYGASCTATCADHGMAVDPATATSAGSAGDYSRCKAVLDSLGVPSGQYSEDVAGSGFGCVFVPGYPAFGIPDRRFRDLSPTTDGAADPYIRRACACE